MNDLTLALGYFGGYVNLALALPRLIAAYRPRRDKRGRWRMTGAQAVVFTPPPGSSGAANHAMLKRFGNDLFGHHLIRHARAKDGALIYTFRAFVPAKRVGWARDLLAYNGCVVDGMAGATHNARQTHGLPTPWADRLARGRAITPIDPRNIRYANKRPLAVKPPRKRRAF